MPTIGELLKHHNYGISLQKVSIGASRNPSDVGSSKWPPLKIDTSRVYSGALCLQDTKHISHALHHQNIQKACNG